MRRSRRCARSSTTTAASPGSTSAPPSVHRTPTSFSYRRSTDRAYLRWTIDTLDAPCLRRPATRRCAASTAGSRSRCPRRPRLHAALLRRRRLQPAADARACGGSTRAPSRGRFASARGATGDGDAAALAGAERRRGARRRCSTRVAARRRSRAGCSDAFLCIHRYEGAWNSNTGNGYYGGLQMDWRLPAAATAAIRRAAGARPTTGRRGRSSRRRPGRTARDAASPVAEHRPRLRPDLANATHPPRAIKVAGAARR